MYYQVNLQGSGIYFCLDFCPILASIKSQLTSKWHSDISKVTVEESLLVLLAKINSNSVKFGGY